MLKSVSKPHQGAGGAVAQDKDACRDVVFSNQRSAALKSVNRPHQTAGGVVAQDKGCLQGGRVHNAGGVVVQDKRGLQGCCALKAALGCTPTCQQITTRRRRRNNAQIRQQATPKRRWRGCLGPRMLAGMSCFPNSESLARQASRWASLVASTTSFRPLRKRDTRGAFRGACVSRLTARPDPLKPAGADEEMPGQLNRGKNGSNVGATPTLVCLVRPTIHLLHIRLPELLACFNQPTMYLAHINSYSGFRKSQFRRAEVSRPALPLRRCWEFETSSWRHWIFMGM